MYYVDVIDNKHEKFNMLVGVSEGPIDSVQKIFINQMEAQEIAGLETEVRLGTTSQSIIPGFEVIKNTFFDGRDFTQDFEDTGSQSIIYPTVSNDVEAVDLQVLFPAGIGAMRTVGDAAGEIRDVSIDYSVRYSVAGNNQWSEPVIRRNTGGSRQAIIDSNRITFPKPGAWDLEIAWVHASRGMRPGTDFYQTVLQNVTEYRGPCGAFSGTALVSVKGVGSKKIQGGQPTLTSLIHGIRPRVYTSPTSYYYNWTQNPSWCLLDYMTNSVYGMGPYITTEDIDIQSFIDFGILSDSQTFICDDTDQCSRSMSDDQAIMGTPRIYTTFPPGSPPPNAQQYALPNPPINPLRMVSTAFSQTLAGMTMCPQCCPHGEFPFITGVRTPDHFCDRPEITAEFRGSSGHGVAGFAMHIYSGATWFDFTGYGFIYNEGLHKFAAVRYNHQSLATTGTILGQANLTLSPGNVVNMLVEPPEYSGANSNYYILQNHILWVSVASSWGGVFTDIILAAGDGGVTSEAGSTGGLNNDWGVNVGAITIPVAQSYPTTEIGLPKYGGYNDQFWDQFTNVCGKCYCEPTFIDWSCNDPAIANCDTQAFSGASCFICPYGAFAQIQYDGGLDVGGVGIRAESTTAADFTGLVALYVPDQGTIGLWEYSHQSLASEGTLLTFVAHTISPGQILGLHVASGQTERYEVLVNSSVLISRSISFVDLDIFNGCYVEVRSGSAFPQPSGNVPTITTTFFPATPPTAPDVTAPTSFYRTCLDTFQVTNDFNYTADSFNNLADSVDLWLKSGSGGISCYGYKYVNASEAESWSHAGDYIEFAYHSYQTTGSPITGVCWQMTESGSSTASSISPDNFTGYVVLNSLVTSELIFGWYKDQSLKTLPPTAQIISVRPNSWMLNVPSGSIHGMAMNVFATLPPSAGAGIRNVTVTVGSKASKTAFNITNSPFNMLVTSNIIGWGAHINNSASPNAFRFGTYRFDNTNFGLVVVGNSATGTHAARWASNSCGPDFSEKDYAFISAPF